MTATKTTMTVAAAVALVAMIAAPALAQSNQRARGAERAQAQQKGQFVTSQQRYRNNPNAVYDNGRYIGVDPDAFIRRNMQHDFRQEHDSQ